MAYNNNRPMSNQRPTLELSPGGRAYTTTDNTEELVEYKQEFPPQSYLLHEDEKIPLFLVKLWNIVEDPNYFEIIRWDETGYSFHIVDPYSFCRNVLPQYFKHNNLNSLIRQLNMYGFRKMTPIERTSLARAQSDQDHLEFSHPCFIKDHPELLVNIKRKISSARHHDSSTAVAGTGGASAASRDLNGVLQELSQLRERQKIMELKMGDLIKENELIWQELGHMRGTHIKQQQIVNKLVQFLMALVQPSKQQARLGKRQLLAIDDDERGAPTGKRGRSAMAAVEEGESSQDVCLQQHTTEMLDKLMGELAKGRMFATPQLMQPKTPDGGTGPIIAEVTDELEQQFPAGVDAQLSQLQAYPTTQYDPRMGELGQQPAAHQQQRYTTRAASKGYAGVKGRVADAPQMFPLAEPVQVARNLQPFTAVGTYAQPVSMATTTAMKPAATVQQAPAPQRMPVQTPPRYLTRHYQQKHPEQQQFEEEHDARYSPAIGGKVSLEPHGEAAPRTLPMGSLQPALGVSPAALRPQDTIQLAAGYSPLSPAPPTDSAGIAVGPSSAPAAPSTLGSTTRNNSAVVGESQDLTQDEFSKYLGQNETSINNLRSNLGNIWDLDDDNFYDFDEQAQQLPVSKAAMNEGTSLLSYGENEGGSEKLAAPTNLLNVPVGTPRKS